MSNAVVLPTVSYGVHVSSPSCSPISLPNIKKMAFFWQLCRIKRNATPHTITRAFVERPRVHLYMWCNQDIRFMHRLSSMPQDSICNEMLQEFTADAPLI